MYLQPRFFTCAGQGAVQFTAELKPSLLPEGSAQTWVHLALREPHKGHSAGEFEFSDDVLNRLITNFRARKNPVQMTFEHPRKDLGQPIPASGYIRDLEVRDTGLWGLAQFTARTADHIRAGEIRFTSVVVNFESIDRKTADPIGPELREVAVTIDPFFDGQVPMALNRDGGPMPEQAPAAPATETPVPASAGPTEDKMPPEELPAVPATEEPGADSTEQQILAQLQEGLGTDLAGVLAYIQENLSALQALATQLPADEPEEEAPPEAMAASRDAANAFAMSRISALETKNTKLTARCEAAEKRLTSTDDTRDKWRLERAVVNGIIDAKDKDRLFKMSRGQPEAFTEWLEDAEENPFIPTGELVVSPNKGAGNLMEMSRESVVYKLHDANLLAIIPDNDKRHAEVIKFCSERRESAGGK